MKILLWIVVAIVVIFAILGFMAPKDYDISRSIEINKPVEEVYPYLTSFENQANWSPWDKKDPHMKKVLTGTDGTVGCVSAWKSDSVNVGTGEQEITKLEPNKRIESELRFLMEFPGMDPFTAVSKGYFNTDEISNGTKVTWGIESKYDFPWNIMMLFFDLEETVGADFESGLNDLKNVMESSASPEPEIEEVAPAEEDATPA
ncbi:MAG: SRPBCC family protein [Bacteroidia bacterium]|nr:SRPBCC family protein [Bacteroidia bacterium]